MASTSITLTGFRRQSSLRQDQRGLPLLPDTQFPNIAHPEQAAEHNVSPHINSRNFSTSPPATSVLRDEEPGDSAEASCAVAADAADSPSDRLEPFVSAPFLIAIFFLVVSRKERRKFNFLLMITVH